MTKKDFRNPPKFTEWILSCFYPDRGHLTSVGDFREEYLEVYSESGPFKAMLWYWIQIVKSIPSYLRNQIYWSAVMITNYLKITLRIIKRHKVYSFINISGFAIGLTCTILMLVYVHHELGYDRYHENAENIYRVINEKEMEWNALSPGALKSALLDDLPEVICAARVCPWGGYIDFNGLINYESKRYIENRFLIVDPEFLEIFTFPLISGDPKTALIEPFSVILTQEMAEKYFSHEDPMGRILKFDNRYEYKITGILKNVPANSHLMFDFLISLNTMYSTSYRGRKSDLINWTHWFSATYIQLEKGCNPNILESKLQALAEKHIGEKSQNEFHLQALTKIYLNNINPPIGKTGDIRYIYLFSGIAFISLLIACFNYMNLSTARSAHRFKEVGIRKIVGAKRPQLIRQFLGESILFAIISLIFSLLLVRFLLPAFGSLIDRELDFNLFYDSWMLFALIFIIVLIGTISGSYPAIFLSSFSPLNTLKWGFKVGSKKSSKVRNSLVIIQFVFSIGLIICTFTVYNQLSYIKNRDLGFKKDHIIIIPVTGMNIERDYEPFKSELSQYSRISDISVSSHLPSLITGGGDAKWEGKTDEKIRFTRGFVDYNFLDLYGIELLEGRNFSKGMTTDIEQAYLLNQTAVKAIGWKAPIGKRFNQWGNKDGAVIGVMDDFHFLSLHRKIEPLVLSLIQNEWEEATHLSIKISSNDIAGTLSFIEKKLIEFSPESPFSYSFFDERIDRMYRSEQKLGQSFIYFTLITIFVACLGLFGLTSFTAEQKTKEIGIRKVLGASVSGIVYLLSRELVKWVLIANLIAWPLAWFFSNRWLQNFAYRINVNIWTFILSAALALAIALITVSYQSVKSARANPVDSLRYE